MKNPLLHFRFSEVGYPFFILIAQILELILTNINLLWTDIRNDYPTEIGISSHQNMILQKTMGMHKAHLVFPCLC